MNLFPRAIRQAPTGGIHSVLTQAPPEPNVSSLFRIHITDRSREVIILLLGLELYFC